MSALTERSGRFFLCGTRSRIGCAVRDDRLLYWLTILNDVIPAEAKRRAGTSSRMCSTRSRIGCAVRDDRLLYWLTILNDVIKSVVELRFVLV